MPFIERRYSLSMESRLSHARIACFRFTDETRGMHPSKDRPLPPEQLHLVGSEIEDTIAELSLLLTAVDEALKSTKPEATDANQH